MDVRHWAEVRRYSGRVGACVTHPASEPPHAVSRPPLQIVQLSTQLAERSWTADLRFTPRLGSGWLWLAAASVMQQGQGAKVWPSR